jgi:hypothetical protein
VVWSAFTVNASSAGWSARNPGRRYKHLGLTHIVIDFRLDDFAKMLDLLDLVTGTIRPRG